MYIRRPGFLSSADKAMCLYCKRLQTMVILFAFSIRKQQNNSWPHIWYMPHDTPSMSFVFHLCGKGGYRGLSYSRLTLSKHRHPVAAVIDEQCRSGRGEVMNDKTGEVKPFISQRPSDPKENNSLTATTKDAALYLVIQDHKLHKTWVIRFTETKDICFSKNLWQCFIYYTLIMLCKKL